MDVVLIFEFVGKCFVGILNFRFKLVNEGF